MQVRFTSDFPNKKELEKRFPYVGEDRFLRRIERLKTMLRVCGYEYTRQDEERIYFRKDDEENMFHSTRTYGLWQIAHQPDEDFNYSISKTMDGFIF